MRHFLLEQTNIHQISTERLLNVHDFAVQSLLHNPFSILLRQLQTFFLSFSFFNRTIILPLQKETEKFLYCEQILQSSEAHEAWGAIGMTSYSF
jgi:hypothetical protein